METATELITPEIAEKYLAASSGNRAIRTAWVDQLAEMMRDGKFYHTHQGIAFNCDGSLKDGHHRLLAIVESDTPQTMQVTFGVEAESMIAVDCGRGRDLADRSVFVGDPLNRKTVAIVRCWLSLYGWITPSDMRMLRFANENQQHLEYVHQSFANSTSFFQHACIGTMLGVASRAGKEEMIDGWFECFKSGVATEPWQSSAISLRDWWMRANRNGGKAERAAMCRRIFSSMNAWTKRKPLSKVYESSTIEWISESEAAMSSAERRKKQESN